MCERTGPVSCLVVLVASMLTGGCESAPKGEGDALSVLPSVTPELKQPEGLDAQSQTRLTQAQRDVDQYLKQRENSTLPTGSEDTGPVGSSTNVAQPPLRQPSKRVIFNGGSDKKREATREKPQTAGEGEATQPSSLFRDPVDVPEVESFDDAVQKPEELNLGTDRLNQLMVDLRRELYIEGAHSDQPLKQLLPIAVMSMIDPNAAINPEAVPDLTPKERELLAALQTFFKSLAERLEKGEDVEEVIARGVNELREAVIQEPTLQLPTLTLCYRVDGYGKYEIFDRYHFLAHSEQQVIVYVEIDDFTSELSEKGEWVTELSQQITIYADRDGIPVWRSGDMQTAIDRAQKQRNDFFLLQIITLPKALSVGKYHMKVHVRDEQSGAEAEDAIEFEMVADPKMAVRMPGMK